MSTAFMGTKICSVGGTLTVLNPQEERTQKYLCSSLINRKFPFKNSYSSLPGHYRSWRR